MLKSLSETEGFFFVYRHKILITLELANPFLVTSRRSFLKQTALTAAGVLIATNLLASTSAGHAPDLQRRLFAGGQVGL